MGKRKKKGEDIFKPRWLTLCPAVNSSVVSGQWSVVTGVCALAAESTQCDELHWWCSVMRGGQKSSWLIIGSSDWARELVGWQANWTTHWMNEWVSASFQQNDDDDDVWVRKQQIFLCEIVTFSRFIYFLNNQWINDNYFYAIKP